MYVGFESDALQVTIDKLQKSTGVLAKKGVGSPIYLNGVVVAMTPQSNLSNVFWKQFETLLKSNDSMYTYDAIHALLLAYLSKIGDHDIDKILTSLQQIFKNKSIELESLDTIVDIIKYVF